MSDPCKTPGCGHATEYHDDRQGCVECPCTRYTAPAETTLAEALAACTHERWATITEGRKPKRWICLTCDTESETAFPSIAEQARRQVLAGAEAAWEPRSESEPWERRYMHTSPDRTAFIAGYLAGKGIDHE